MGLTEPPKMVRDPAPIMSGVKPGMEVTKLSDLPQYNPNWDMHLRPESRTGFAAAVEDYFVEPVAAFFTTPLQLGFIDLPVGALNLMGADIERPELWHGVKAAGQWALGGAPDDETMAERYRQSMLAEAQRREGMDAPASALQFAGDMAGMLQGIFGKGAGAPGGAAFRAGATVAAKGAAAVGAGTGVSKFLQYVAGTKRLQNAGPYMRALGKSVFSAKTAGQATSFGALETLRGSWDPETGEVLDIDDRVFAGLKAAVMFPIFSTVAQGSRLWVLKKLGGKDGLRAQMALTKHAVEKGIMPASKAEAQSAAYQSRVISSFVDAGMPGMRPQNFSEVMATVGGVMAEGVAFTVIDTNFWGDVFDYVLDGDWEAAERAVIRLIGTTAGMGVLRAGGSFANFSLWKRNNPAKLDPGLGGPATEGGKPPPKIPPGLPKPKETEIQGPPLKPAEPAPPKAPVKAEAPKPVEPPPKIELPARAIPPAEGLLQAGWEYKEGKFSWPGSGAAITVNEDGTLSPSKTLRRVLNVKPEDVDIGEYMRLVEQASLMSSLQSRMMMPGAEFDVDGSKVVTDPGKPEMPTRYVMRFGTVLERPMDDSSAWKLATVTPKKPDAISVEQQGAVERLADWRNMVVAPVSDTAQLLMEQVIDNLRSINAENDSVTAETLRYINEGGLEEMLAVAGENTEHAEAAIGAIAHMAIDMAPAVAEQRFEETIQQQPFEKTQEEYTKGLEGPEKARKAKEHKRIVQEAEVAGERVPEEVSAQYREKPAAPEPTPEEAQVAEAEAARERSVRAKKRYSGQRGTKQDELLTFIAKEGGLSREDATKLFDVKPEDITKKSGIRPIFTKKGKSADAIMEEMAIEGFDIPVEGDIQVLGEMLQNALLGKEVRSETYDPGDQGPDYQQWIDETYAKEDPDPQSGAALTESLTGWASAAVVLPVTTAKGIVELADKAVGNFAMVPTVDRLAKLAPMIGEQSMQVIDLTKQKLGAESEELTKTLKMTRQNVFGRYGDAVNQLGRPITIFRGKKGESAGVAFSSLQAAGDEWTRDFLQEQGLFEPSAMMPEAMEIVGRIHNHMWASRQWFAAAGAQMRMPDGSFMPIDPNVKPERIPRRTTPGGYQFLMSADAQEYADLLAPLNGLTGEVTLRQLRVHLNRGYVRPDPIEFARTLKIMPDIFIRRNGEVIQVFEADPYMVAHNVVSQGAHRSSFGEVFTFDQPGETKKEPGLFGELDTGDPADDLTALIRSSELVRNAEAEAGPAAAREAVKVASMVFRSLNYMPVYEPMMPTIGMHYGSPGHTLMRRFRAGMQLWAASKLTLAWIPNFFESFGIPAQQLGLSRISKGWVSVISAISRSAGGEGEAVVDLIKRHAKTRATTRDVHRFTVRPGHRVEDVVAAATWPLLELMKLTVETSELVVAEAVDVAVSEWKSGTLSDGRRIKDLNMLSRAGFPDDVAKRVVSGEGTDEEHGRFARKAVSMFMVGSTAHGAEKPEFEHHRLASTVIKFTSYGRNVSYRVTQHVKKVDEYYAKYKSAKAAGDAEGAREWEARAKAETAQLLWATGHLTASGAGSLILRALLGAAFGAGLRELIQLGREAAQDPVDMAIRAFGTAAFAGPGGRLTEAFMEGRVGSFDAAKSELVGLLAPWSAIEEVGEAVTGGGQFAGTETGFKGLFLRMASLATNDPLSKKIKNLLFTFGAPGIGHNPKLMSVMMRWNRWMRKNVPGSKEGSFPDPKPITLAMREIAALGQQSYDPKSPEVQAVLADALKIERAAGPVTLNDLVRSLKGQRKAFKDDGTMKSLGPDVSEEMKSALLKWMGEDMEYIRAYDLMLTKMADALKE